MADTAREEEALLLPVSQVAEWAYCPRNFYYRQVEGRENGNVYTVAGSLEEDARNERSEVTRQNRVQIRHLAVDSPILGLTGILDAAEEENGTLYPVEYKHGKDRGSLNDAIQVAAQAMLLEEATGRSVPFGVLYYKASGNRRTVRVDEDLRERVRAIECGRNRS